MTCIIDVGGGNKGAFGAGVLERCLDEGIVFDRCIGVSAGSGNIITYAAGQKGRLYRYYHEYAFQKEYMSLQNILKTGHFINLDYIFSPEGRANGEEPLDIDAARRYPGQIEITVTDAVSGTARFIPLEDVPPDDYWCLKASCAIPFVCRTIKHDGRAYFDGGLANPVPIDHALELGCDKIVVILTRPRDFRKVPGADAKSAPFMRRKYPKAADLLLKRAEQYNIQVDRAIELEKEGRLRIICPPVLSDVSTLKKTPESIDRLFRTGYQQAGRIRDYLG